MRQRFRQMFSLFAIRLPALFDNRRRPFYTHLPFPALALSNKAFCNTAAGVPVFHSDVTLTQGPMTIIGMKQKNGCNFCPFMIL